MADTKTNGSDYAGYKPDTSYTGNRLVIMTEQYGRDQQLDVTCSNKDLAAMLGISDASMKMVQAYPIESCAV